MLLWNEISAQINEFLAAAAGGSMLSQFGAYSPEVNAGLAISIIGTIIFAIYFVASILLCVGASKGKFMFLQKYYDKLLMIDRFPSKLINFKLLF